MARRINPLILAFSIFLSCAFQQRNENEIRGIELVFSIPSYNNVSGKPIAITDSIQLYYNGTDALIRETYTSTSYNNKSIKDGTFVITDNPEEISRKERKMYNFFYNKDNSLGLKYDSIGGKGPKLFNVDSMLNKRTFKQLKLYDPLNDVLVKTKKNADGTVLEAYIPKVKYDPSYNDTTYFLFDPKFKSVPYSLSKELDSIKKMKLIDARLVYNAIPKSPSNPNGLPAKEFHFRIKDINTKGDKELEQFFTLFRKDKASLISK